MQSNNHDVDVGCWCVTWRLKVVSPCRVTSPSVHVLPLAQVLQFITLSYSIDRSKGSILDQFENVAPTEIMLPILRVACQPTAALALMWTVCLTLPRVAWSSKGWQCGGGKTNILSPINSDQSWRSTRMLIQSITTAKAAIPSPHSEISDKVYLNTSITLLVTIKTFDGNAWLLKIMTVRRYNWRTDLLINICIGNTNQRKLRCSWPNFRIYLYTTTLISFIETAAVISALLVPAF